MKKQKLIFILLCLLIMPLLMVSCWGPPIDGGDSGTIEDPHEPNNTHIDANVIYLYVEFSSVLSYDGDIDYMKFNAIEGKTYRIHMTNIREFEPEMSLFGTNGTTLIEMKNTGTYTDTYDWWGYDAAHNYLEEEKESIVFTAEESGYYYISVKDLYDAHDDFKYGYYSIYISEIINIGEATLTAEPNNTNFRIDVNWTQITGVDGYRLYRTITPQNLSNPNYEDFTLIRIQPTTTFYDINIQPNVTYYYYVKGYYQTFEGDPSNVDDAILSVSVGQVQNLVANPNTTNISIDVEWDVLTDVQGYKLYRTTTPQDLGNPNYGDFVLIETQTGTTYNDTNVGLNITYYYYVKGYILTIDGNPSNVDDAIISVSVGQAQNLVATENIGTFTIDVIWDALTDPLLNGYRLYRTTVTQDLGNPNYNDFTLIQTQTGTSYNDSNVELNTTYYYYVKGYFQTVEGTPSNVDDATLTIGGTQDLDATADQINYEIDVTWGSIAGVDGYNLYRTTTIQDIGNPNYSDFTLLQTLSGVGNTSYSDTTIQYNTRYYYYVIGYIGSSTNEQGDESNIDFATVVLDGPQNLVAAPNSLDFQIDVTWDILSDVQGYKLYRTTTTQDLGNPNYNDFTLLTTITGNTNTSYEDTNIQPNTTYYYYVRGYRGSKNGGPSNVDDALFDWANFKPRSSLINASEGLSSRIEITLMDKYNNSNIIRYEIYRADSQAADPGTYVYIDNFLQSAPIGSKKIDTNVVPGTYYYYCVRIVINISGTEYFSKYSWFDSGVADN